jgi:hypothetical protein
VVLACEQGCPLAQRVIDIGTPESFNKAEKILKGKILGVMQIS